MTEAEAALEAVAQRFSATLEVGRNLARTCLAIEGRSIVVEVATLALRAHDASASVRPKLRFDKAVRRVVGRLQAALSDLVPDGSTVVLTMTAPIRLAAKTAVDLEVRIRACLSEGRDRIEDTIHGNQVLVRIVAAAPKPASRVVGFVHNPDTDPRLLLDMSRSLLECLSAATGEASAEGDRWLVLVVGSAGPPIESWRQVYVQLSVKTAYEKILIVLPGGRVETLTP